MLVHIPKIIDQTQLDVLVPAIASAPFVDGKGSAGITAREVKQNLEVDQSSEVAQNLAKIIIGNLYNNKQFRDVCLPLRIATPVLSKYGAGQKYGLHIDDPVMGGDGQKFRCDIAMTLFMTEPSEYEGGELEIQTEFGQQQCKYPAGDLVLYPASSLHKVNEVRSGVRHVAVTWVQSMVRDPAKREILYNLCQARDTLNQHPKLQQSNDQVEHSYNNLIRMWSEI